jgi:hypothetical protein
LWGEKPLRTFKAIVSVFIVCLLAGCSTFGQESDTGGTVMEEIPFQVVSLEQVPSQLQNQAQESLQSPGESIRLLSADSKKYVILSLGEKPTAGYKIDVKKVEQKGNKLVVHAQKHEPSKDSFQAQVITYPAVIIVTEPKNHVENAEVHWL